MAWALILVSWNAGFAGSEVVPTKAEQQKEARALFESALPLAEGGNAVAQYRVGVIYFDGMGGVPRDRKAGLEWMQRAAAGGHAEARFQLGRIYETGEGAPVDHKRAYELYGAAAEQTHGNAAPALGMMCLTGTGVPQNDKQVLT